MTHDPYEAPPASDRSGSEIILLRLATRLRSVPAKALPTLPRMVLLVLADHTNRASRVAWPKLETIAQEAGASVNATREALALLVRCGWLRMTAEPTPRTAARYEVQYDGRPVEDVLAEHPRRVRAPRGGSPEVPVRDPRAGQFGSASRTPGIRQVETRDPPGGSEPLREPLREPPIEPPIAHARDRTQEITEGEVQRTIPFGPSPEPAIQPRKKTRTPGQGRAEDRYAAAYLRGHADMGFPITALAPAEKKILGTIAQAHARYRSGEPITGEELVQWFYRRASDFRRDVPDPARHRGGASPFGFRAWLDNGADGQPRPGRPGEPPEDEEEPPPPELFNRPLPPHCQPTEAMLEEARRSLDRFRRPEVVRG